MFSQKICIFCEVSLLYQGPDLNFSSTLCLAQAETAKMGYGNTYPFVCLMKKWMTKIYPFYLNFGFLGSQIYESKINVFMLNRPKWFCFYKIKCA